MRLFGFLSSFFAWCFWPCATSAVPAVQSHRRRLGRAIIILTVASGAVLWLWRPVSQPAVQINAGDVPTIEQIRALADLVTAKVTITDARETTLGGYLGDVKAVLVIRGDALLGPDLSKAQILSCNSTSKTITIELPTPHLISYRLDHTATRLVSFSHDGLWMIVPGDASRTAVLNRAYREAERAIADAAMTPATIHEASVDAQQALDSFFALGGWNASIRWIPSD